MAEVTETGSNPPYSNCRYKICDLPGQCRGEGSCHHPASGDRKVLQPTMDGYEEADAILVAMGLDPAYYRTEGGALNMLKVKAAIANPDQYPRIEFPRAIAKLLRDVAAGESESIPASILQQEAANALDWVERMQTQVYDQATDGVGTVLLSEEQEINLSKTVGADRWEGLRRYAMRLAFKLNTDPNRRGLLDYAAASQFAQIIVSNMVNKPPLNMQRAMLQHIADKAGVLSVAAVIEMAATYAEKGYTSGILAKQLRYIVEEMERCAPNDPGNNLQDPDGLAVEQEPKYTINGRSIINRASGNAIPTDEPVFIFRARDQHAYRALLAYSNIVADAGHREAVMQRVEDFLQFQKRAPDRMKEPDTVKSA